MTIHCWGERAAGDWILEVYDTPSQLRNFKTPGEPSLPRIGLAVQKNAGVYSDQGCVSPLYTTLILNHVILCFELSA